MANIEENIKRLGGLVPIRSEEFGPMPEEDVSDIERLLRARLPEEYRRFLVTYGASSFKHNIAYKMIEPLAPGNSPDDHTGIIELFWGKETGSYNFVWNMDCYRKDNRMPQTLIPIGGDLFGNQICIGIAGSERGKVYGWDHENEANPDYYTEQGLPVPPRLMFQNVNLIANSFEEFFDQMYVSEYADEAE